MRLDKENSQRPGRGSSGTTRWFWFSWRRRNAKGQCAHGRSKRRNRPLDDCDAGDCLLRPGFLFGVDLLDLAVAAEHRHRLSRPSTKFRLREGARTSPTRVRRVVAPTQLMFGATLARTLSPAYSDQLSEFGQVSSRTLGSNTKNRISSCLMALCSPLAAWLSPQWAHFTVLWIKRFTSTCPSIRT